MPFPARSLLWAAILAVCPLTARAEKPPSLSAGDAVPLPDPSAAQQFFLEEGGKALGPLTLPQLRARVAAGQVAADRLVWKAGTAKWVSARDLLEIAEFYSQTSAEPKPAATPAAPPVKKVTTVPMTPGGAPPAAGDLSAYLTGTWKSEGGKQGDVTYAFGADGTLATRGPAPGGEAVILRGTFTVDRKDTKAFLLKFNVKAETGADVVTQAGERSMEIVDADTLRDLQAGSTLRRTTKTVELRLKPAADSACGGGKVLLSDDFRQIEESWGLNKDDPSVSVADGKVKVKPRGDHRFQFVYADTRLADGEVCVTAQIPRAFRDPVDVIGGVIFWARDLANYYGFAVSPTGNAGLLRQVDGKFENLVAFHKAEGLNPQPGAKNVLRVVIRGDAVTAYVNGVRFAGVTAKPPTGGGSVGFFVQSEGARPNGWKFGRLVVTGMAP